MKDKMKEKKETPLSIAITILTVIIVIVVFTCMIISFRSAYTARVDACIDLGYSGIGNSGSMSIYGSCADSDDNLHFEKWTCEQKFIIASCAAKDIKQGDVVGELK